MSIRTQLWHLKIHKTKTLPKLLMSIMKSSKHFDYSMNSSCKTLKLSSLMFWSKFDSKLRKINVRRKIKIKLQNQRKWIILLIMRTLFAQVGLTLRLQKLKWNKYILNSLEKFICQELIDSQKKKVQERKEIFQLLIWRIKTRMFSLLNFHFKLQNLIPNRQ